MWGTGDGGIGIERGARVMRVCVCVLGHAFADWAVLAMCVWCRLATRLKCFGAKKVVSRLALSFRFSNLADKLLLTNHLVT